MNYNINELTRTVDSLSKVYLGVDPANQTGFAFADPEGTPLYWFSEDFGPQADEPEGVRWEKFHSRLSTIFATLHLVGVYYEEVMFHSSVAAAHTYGGLRAILTAQCERWAVPCRGVNVATVKRVFAGKGNATKKRMAEVAREKWGHDLDWTPKTTDCCDAAAIAWVGLNNEG